MKYILLPAKRKENNMAKSKDLGNDPVKNTAATSKQKDRNKVSGKDSTSPSDVAGPYEDSDSKYAGKVRKKNC
jgi:hypothetical protein